MNLLPIWNVEQIRRVDAGTIEKSGIRSVDLMDRAVNAFVQEIEDIIVTYSRFFVFCGTGNNGGDGLGIARMLMDRGKDCTVVVWGNTENFSVDCAIQYNRLKERENACIRLVQEYALLPEYPGSDAVIIDALWGSGLNRPLEGENEKIVEWINASPAKKISVDIPSGLFADQLTRSAAVEADLTVTFGNPKLAFMFPSGGKYTGAWKCADIGLMNEIIPQEEKTTFYITEDDAKVFLGQLRKKRTRFSHKGNFGRVLIVAGSKGKMGAAVLCARAALRSGAGLLTVHVPACGEVVLQTSVPEAMVVTDASSDEISRVEKPNDYSVIAAGLGIGVSKKTASALEQLLRECRVPLVLDADAINLLATHPGLLNLLPPGTVLTPHVKEAERLIGECADDFERFEKARKWAMNYQCVFVLKGTHTCICTPDGKAFFNSTGNPGMAKGGSGDALTGIIASMRAQGFPAEEAAILGVFIHGKAGDIAAGEYSPVAMLPSDLIESLPLVFKERSGENGS